jgi:hypothetical protein
MERRGPIQTTTRGEGLTALVVTTRVIGIGRGRWGRGEGDAMGGGVTRRERESDDG